MECQRYPYNIAQVPKPPERRKNRDCDDDEKRGAVIFDVRTHIGEAFYALAVDGELELFCTSDHESLFGDAFVTTSAPAFGRNRVAYMSMKDGGCDLSCEVVQYSDGAFIKVLSVDGVSPRYVIYGLQLALSTSVGKKYRNPVYSLINTRKKGPYIYQDHSSPNRSIRAIFAPAKRPRRTEGLGSEKGEPCARREAPSQKELKGQNSWPAALHLLRPHRQQDNIGRGVVQRMGGQEAWHVFEGGHRERMRNHLPMPNVKHEGDISRDLIILGQS